MERVCCSERATTLSRQRSSQNNHMNKKTSAKTEKKVALKDLKARKEIKGGHGHQGHSHKYLH